MQTKLTLRLEEELVESAKKYASIQGKSVSRMVADYFVLLRNLSEDNRETLGPVTTSLKGGLGKGALGRAEIDESDYIRYLAEKYS